MDGKKKAKQHLDYRALFMDLYTYLTYHFRFNSRPEMLEGPFCMMASLLG